MSLDGEKIHSDVSSALRFAVVFGRDREKKKQLTKLMKKLIPYRVVFFLHVSQEEITIEKVSQLYIDRVRERETRWTAFTMRREKSMEKTKTDSDYLSGKCRRKNTGVKILSVWFNEICFVAEDTSRAPRDEKCGMFVRWRKAMKQLPGVHLSFTMPRWRTFAFEGEWTFSLIAGDWCASYGRDSDWDLGKAITMQTSAERWSIDVPI